MSAGADRIAFADVGKRFGETTAVEHVTFSIAPREIVCILGPSGCGKSTCLSLAAGFEAPSDGEVRIDGRAVTGPGHDRSVVFQTPALFPWKTVYENVALGPRCRGEPRVRERALELIAAVGLEDFVGHYPYQLSGGMMQRTSLARALLNNPEILLMDEPFGALDAQTRLSMQEMLLAVWERFQSTIMFITHDVDEAIFLGDRVLVMSRRPGRIQEEIMVPFAKPRSYEVLTSPEFADVKLHILQYLHGHEKVLPGRR